MRNLFDQYESPENRLTHALVSVLLSDRTLIRPFLRWLGIPDVPPLRKIHLEQQRAPGQEAEAEKDGEEGVPDASFYDDDGWAVLVESKLQAGISSAQLRRHDKTAARYGYPHAHVVLIAIDRPRQSLPDGVRVVEWRSVYSWFCRHSTRSEWARTFAGYVRTLEARLIAQNYGIKGTMTMFTGFQFDESHPYTYQEGRRLIRLIAKEFRKSRCLVRSVGIDPEGAGRPAITRGEDGSVWDCIPLRAAKGAPFTAYPHVTMVVGPARVCTAATIPNGLRRGSIRGCLLAVKIEAFKALLAKIEVRLRPVLRKVPGARPMLYISQRRYKSQKSIPEVDGTMRVDLRTAIDGGRPPLKHQPMWVEAFYELLTHKRTNMQLGIEVEFPVSAPIIQTPDALHVMVEAWVAMSPLIAFFR